MGNAHFCEKGVEFLVLASPIRLHGKNFTAKLPFNGRLEFMEFLKNFRFVFKEIYPCELAEIINEADIVFIIPKRITSMSPYIRKH